MPLPIITPFLSSDMKRKIMILVLSCFVMLTSGSFSTFTLFADSFREKFGLSFSDINMISAVMNSSLYLSYLAVGPMFDQFGPKVCQLVSAAAFSLGYFLIYLSLIQAIPTSAAALATYYFIGGFGSCGVYMSAIGTSTANFDESIVGLIGGILLLFYGIAGVLYSLVFKAFYTANIEGFLFFILLTVFIINFCASAVLEKIPPVGVVEEQVDVKLGPSSDNNQRIIIASSQPIYSETFELVTPSSTTKTPQSPQSPDDQIDAALLSAPEDSTESNERKRLLSLKTDGLPVPPTPLKTPTVSMTPREMLTSPLFWSYAIATILQQGLTYQVNINAIIQTSLGPTVSIETGTELTALHVTLISAFQSIGRFVFGAGSDVVAKFGMERSLLLVVANIFLFIPPLLLSSVADFTSITQNSLLCFCSILVGLGWGAGGGLFPTLTRSLFGSKYYGTASAFVMVGVPIGIFSFNGLFGALYDAQLQKQTAVGGPSDYCYGNDCFKVAFIATTVVQTFTLISAVLLVHYSRQKTKRLRNLESPL